MLGIPMPFPSVPCSIWLPHAGGPDGHGNARPAYTDEPDIETRCCYAPGMSTPQTYDEIGMDRPTGDREEMIFYLPKTLVADLRGAIIAAYPPDDPHVAGNRYKVEGAPRSFHRDSTPGDYSWCVLGVRVLG